MIYSHLYKKTFIALLFFTLCIKINVLAQQEESEIQSKSSIGFAAGVMNYSGFMQTKAFTFNQAKPAGEIMYRYNVTDQFHIRATALIGSLRRDNGDSLINGVDRTGMFKTNIFEVDILPEYDFFNMATSNWKYKYKWSPYIYFGGGFYRLFNYEANRSGTINLAAFNLRGGIGVKYAVTPDMQMFFEADRRELSKEIDFYESRSRSHYYSLMLGLNINLVRRHYKNYW